MSGSIPYSTDNVNLWRGQPLGLLGCLAAGSLERQLLAAQPRSASVVRQRYSRITGSIVNHLRGRGSMASGARAHRRGWPHPTVAKSRRSRAASAPPPVARRASPRIGPSTRTPSPPSPHDGGAPPPGNPAVISDLTQHLREQRASSYHCPVSGWGKWNLSESPSPAGDAPQLIASDGLFWTSVLSGIVGGGKACVIR